MIIIIMILDVMSFEIIRTSGVATYVLNVSATLCVVVWLSCVQMENLLQFIYDGKVLSSAHCTH